MGCRHGAVVSTRGLMARLEIDLAFTDLFDDFSFSYEFGLCW